jgi:predicted secreted hydrolase
MAIDLTLAAGKPPVLQGERGLSQKGPEPGNASYYYSLTRMPARGAVVVDGDSIAVSGLAWLDREWSTSALSADQVGWDWFALQLDDGWDMMAYRLRRADGTADEWSEAVIVDPDGTPTRLAFGDDIALESTRSWSSSIDGAVYPSGWRITIPARGWDLAIEPRIPEQELVLSFRYWEGAVSVTGSGEGGSPASGRGYVELTGYAGEAPER